MEDFLRVGVITRTHGVRGEVKVYPTTDDPRRFLDLKEVFTGPDNDRSLSIENVRFFKNLVILKFTGIDDMDTAAGLVRSELYIPRSEGVPLEEGEYYIADLIGMDVFSDEGEHLGTVKDVLETGANDVFIVDRKGAGQLLLPYITECVLDIDPASSRMTVHLMEGLLDL